MDGNHGRFDFVGFFRVCVRVGIVIDERLEVVFGFLHPVFFDAFRGIPITALIP
jgi:hypothetical protein